MEANSPVLVLEEVTKKYESVGEVPAPEVLKGVSLEAERGESMAVVGPSGSGKSTLLNIIGTLDPPTGGRVLLEGQDPSRMNDDELAFFRNERLGFVFQSHHLLPQCTVLENVLVPTLVNPAMKRKESVRDRSYRLLERVGLKDRLGHRPAQLSGGERQRVAVVRALINEPVLLLADEPTGSLDTRTADELGRLLVEINREEEVTTLIVTHSPKLACLMGSVYRLEEGVLISEEPKP